MKKFLYLNENLVMPELNVSLQYKYGKPKNESNLEVFAVKYFIPVEDGIRLVNKFKQKLLSYDKSLVNSKVSDEELFNSFWEGKYRLETHKAEELGLYAVCVAHDDKQPLEEELLVKGNIDCSLELYGYPHMLMAHKDEGDAFLKDCRRQIREMAPDIAKDYKDDVELFNLCYELGLVDYYCTYEKDGKRKYYIFHSVCEEDEEVAC